MTHLDRIAALRQEIAELATQPLAKAMSGIRRSRPERAFRLAVKSRTRSRSTYSWHPRMAWVVHHHVIARGVHTHAHAMAHAHAHAGRRRR